MYKTFLSWRYMRARRTNLIGVIGIGVGVGALIMILSIMTGFLEETKKSLRGGLADIIVEVSRARLSSGQKPPMSTQPILEVVRTDPPVAAACAELSWGGQIGVGGRGAGMTSEILSDPQAMSMTFVRFFGIDVQDAFAATNLREALLRPPTKEHLLLLGDTRVADVDDPFAPPPGYEPDGRPLASCLVGEQLAKGWRIERGSEIWIRTGVPDPKTGEIPPNDRRYVVAGTFRSGENEMDLQRIYFERAELADFLSADREYSQILVKVH